MHKFVRKVLIEENIVKFKFNENWDPKQKKYKENVIGFIKTIIKYQLLYFLKEEHAKNLTEVSYAKNADGLSGTDKMLMNMSKSDEGDTLLAELNAEDIVEEIQKIYDIPISEEEIQYYIKNHHPSKDQIRLVSTFYGRIFGNGRDAKLVTRRQYIIMMLVLKNKLLFDAGVVSRDTGVVENTALPYVISGNLDGLMNTRIIKNAKFNESLEEDYQYEELNHSLYNLLNEIKPDEINSLISSFVNSSYTYCCFERPDLLGKKIVYPDMKITNELIFFLRSS